MRSEPFSDLIRFCNSEIERIKYINPNWEDDKGSAKEIILTYEELKKEFRKRHDDIDKNK